MKLSRAEAKENLAKLIEKFEKETSSGRINDYNEEATKTAFIQPFLRNVLGWNVSDRDEVSPEERTSRGRVDYGLKIQDQIKLFIEVKPPRADLDKHIKQAVGYGYNRKGVPFVLLTDFEGLKLFDVTIKPDTRNPLKGLKIDLDWKEYLFKFDKIWLLSKESVLNGELDKLLLKKPKDRLPVDKAILDDLKKWREKLAKDIFKNNPNLFHSPPPSLPPRKGEEKGGGADYLKEITQRIIDRIMFMRSCEDRKLIHRRSLKELFEERTETVGTNTMVFLKEEFKHYNIIFDSDLFRPQDWEANLAIEFKVMKDIILDTYNPYQFDVIPLEVLGNMYEQYLGYTIRLTDHQVKYELKPDVRKAGGVYYTPEYIVDYIVKNTVGKLLQELPASRFLSFRAKRGISSKTKKLRILDPACGSGSFLIRAYEEMLNYYRGQKKKKSTRYHHSSPLKGEHNPQNSSPFKGEDKGGGENSGVQRVLSLPDGDIKPILTIEEKAQILQEHIFGVDIDEQAVEVTKLSLMLKMLEGEFGIIPGRSILPMLDKNIRCGNSLISGDTLELKKYFGDDWYKVKAFNWKDAFRKIMVDEGGFDVVIGNPPYGYMISQDLKNYFTEKYIHQDYQKDWYLLFLERYHHILKYNGFLGVIVSNTWLQSIKLQNIRRYLTTNYIWHNILLLPEKVFEAVVDTHVLIFEKSEKGMNNKNILSVDIKQSKEILHCHNLSGNYIINDGSPININASPQKHELSRKILKISIRLNRICNAYNGVKPFEKGKGSPPQTSDIIKTKPYVKKGTLPAKNWSSLLRGSLIGRYQNFWKNNYWIKYGPWLAAQRDPAIFSASEKIMVRQTGDSIIATLVKSGFIARNNLHVLLPKQTKYNLKYILSLMNSNLMDFIYTIMNPEKGEALAEVKKVHVEQLPIRKIDFNNNDERILHDDLVALVDVMLDLNKKVQTARGSRKDQIQRQIAKTDREIDELVYELYRITEEERKVIENYG